MKKTIIVLSSLLISLASSITSCKKNDNKVLIYTSSEDYNMELMKTRLNEKFPTYDISIEYLSTSNIAAKVIEEGEKSDCDIVYAEEYGYVEKMISAGVLDSVKDIYDSSRYLDDTVSSTVKEYTIPSLRTGGGVILNNQVLNAKGISKPTSYDDLLKPEFKGLVSMASPKSSGTGYMFLYSLVKARGEENALNYFDQLTPNVLSYTTSGSGPVNALVNREVAVGFGMISQASVKINEGNKDLEIVFFKEGAPYNLYGTSVVKGKLRKKAVKEVMEYIDTTYTNEVNALYYPEPVLKNVTYNVENFPKDIKYSNMEGNNLTNKESILNKWNH